MEKNDNTFNDIWIKKSKGKGEILAQNYDSLIVLDFEATCLKDMRINPQEIIDFSCVEFDLKKQQIVDNFSKYVKPIFRPNLSPFCIKLTGITQEDVDRADDFAKVYENFLNWMEKRKGRKFIFATCGDWDLLTMLPAQVRLSNCSEGYPDYLKRWINLERAYDQVNRVINACPNNISEKHDLWPMMDVLTLEKGDRWSKKLAVSSLIHWMLRTDMEDMMLLTQGEVNWGFIDLVCNALVFSNECISVSTSMCSRTG